ncbi:hypothetical protein CKF54_06950 [Psittacicella hinzii]|uniref:Autotransporter domain-containing protein n=1 Tax=Psittacicella hinzii TaxID=2028575 RepID=A0A3A1Y1E9_9GAMM|nr:S8 family serine peptidase [Psittacicella hinzii]RIY31281.1 hypothetical protein CKF54_06950 [Psittacicella hinzii]
MSIRKLKLNSLNNSIVAVISAILLASCGGGGGGGSQASNTASTSLSTALTAVSTTQLVLPTNGSATNDYNVTLTDVSFANTSAQSVANASFTSSQTANTNAFTISHTSTGNTTLTGWPTDKSSGNAVNYNNLLALGLVNVVSGEGVTVNGSKYYLSVTGSSASYYDKQATLAENSTSFTGSNVKVGLIDGSLNKSWEGFNSSNFNEVVTTNQYSTDTTNNTILGSDSDHGTTVAAIIAAQRNTTYNGLTPNVTIYYNQLNNYSANNLLGEIYTAMYNTSASIINNSYYIPYLVTDTETKDIITASSYTSAYSALKTITAKSDTPLFIFSSGNYDYLAYLQAKYQADSSVTSSWTDVNYGRGLDTNSSLYQFSQDNDIADAMIVVTGYTLDVNNAYTAVANKAKNQVSNTTALSENTTTNSQFSSSLYVAGIVGYSTGAITAALQCGVVKYNCVAGAYTWDVANYNASGSRTFVGTSGSAPIVSAVAAMVKEQFDWMTAKQLKTTLLTTAYDIGEQGVDDVFGWGVIDASVALNGPGAFVFGDFNANISGTGKRYFFNNNITGNYGLVVEGANSDDQLVLTGSNNTYTGDTVVKGGVLVLQDKSSAGIGGTNETTVSLKSNLYINSFGRAAAYNATLANVTNNGYLQLQNTQISGNFVNKDNATLATNLSYFVNVSGNATLDGTLALINTKAYVNTGKTTQVKVLTAKNITGNFDQIVSDYDDSATVNCTVLQNSTSVYVNLTASSASTYLTSAEVSQADYQAYSAGASQVDKLLTAADAITTTASQVTVTGTGEVSTGVSLTSADSVATTATASSADVALTSTASTDGVALTADDSIINQASNVQSLSASELNDLLLRASGTIYSNLLQATSQQARTNLLDFSNVALGRFASLDNQWHAYADYSYRWQDWDSNSSLKGHLDANAYTVGAYTQTLTGYNLGFAVQTLSGNWDEGSATSNITAGFAKVKSYGFSASFGKALERVYYGATLYANFNDFKVTRTVFSDADQKVNFDSQNYGLDLSAGWLALGNLERGLIVNGGLTAEFTHQDSFNESATNAASQLVSLSAQSRWYKQLFAHAGVKAFTQFKTFGFNSAVEAGLSVTGKVAGSDYKLRLADGSTTGQVFDNDFLARLNLGYSINLTNNFKISLGGNLEKTADWNQKAVKLALDYKF